MRLNMNPSLRGLVHQYLATATATIAVVITGNAMGWPSPTLPKLLTSDSPVPLDNNGTSWMVAFMYLGNIFSPIPCGLLMDWIGRKSTLLCLNILPLSSWLLIIFTRTPTLIFLARFLAGLWLGIVYTVVPIYLGEIAEPHVRGSLSTFFAIMTYVGVLFEYIVGPYVSYNTLAIASGSFCIIFYLTFSWMPESPYFLLMKKHPEKAKASLAWFRGNAPNVNEELFSITNAVESQMKNKGSLKDLFVHRGNRRAFFIVGILSILQRLSGIGAMIAYTSTTLPKDALGLIGANECVIILGIVWVVATLVSLFLVDKLGRKILLIISAIGCGLATFVAGGWFYLDSNTNFNVSFLNWVPFAAFILHGLSYSVGLNPIVTTIKGEVFAANIKGVASALTSLMLAMCSFFLNKTYQLFADDIGMYFNYWLYALGCFIAVIYTVTCVIETKGKTLQEIQEILNQCDSTDSNENEVKSTKL